MSYHLPSATSITKAEDDDDLIGDLFEHFFIHPIDLSRQKSYLLPSRNECSAKQLCSHKRNLALDVEIVNGRVKAPVTINGISMLAITDSGSDQTIVGGNFCRQLMQTPEINVVNSGETMSVMGCRNIIPEGECYCEVKAYQFTKRIRVLFASRLQATLLGRDFIRAAGIGWFCVKRLDGTDVCCLYIPADDRPSLEFTADNVRIDFQAVADVTRCQVCNVLQMFDKQPIVCVPHKHHVCCDCAAELGHGDACVMCVRQKVKLESRDAVKVPLIVIRITEQVEERGIGSPLLYYVTGPRGPILKLVEHLATGVQRNLTPVPIPVLTGAMFVFLRSLEESVITAEVRSLLFESASRRESIQLSEDALRQLPSAHLQTLAFLIIHLQRLLASSNRFNIDMTDVERSFGLVFFRFSNDIQPWEYPLEMVLQQKMLRRMLNAPVQFWRNFLPQSAVGGRDATANLISELDSLLL